MFSWLTSGSIIAHCDVGRVWVFHADNVVAGIDMVDLSGHAP